MHRCALNLVDGFQHDMYKLFYVLPMMNQETRFVRLIKRNIILQLVHMNPVDIIQLEKYTLVPDAVFDILRAFLTILGRQHSEIDVSSLDIHQYIPNLLTMLHAELQLIIIFSVKFNFITPIFSCCILCIN